MNIAEFLLNIFKNIGITDGFSLVGGMSMNINAAAHDSEIRITYCNHEQAAVSAAEGYAKADLYSRPALAIVTSGPGVTNTITSVASAFYDSVPLILLSGQVKSADVNAHGVRSFGAQEAPHVALLSSVAKLSFRYDPQEVNDRRLAEYVALSMIGRKGPVHIEVPLDIQSRDCKTKADVDLIVSLYHEIVQRQQPSEGVTTAELMQRFYDAKRPLLVLGNGLRVASIPFVRVRALAERLGVPCLLTWASMDILDHDHPLAFGCAGGLAGTHSNRILQTADVILFLGVRLDLLTTGFSPQTYGKNAQRFVVDVDDAEIEKNAQLPSFSAVRADLRDFIPAFESCAVSCAAQETDWLHHCRAWRSENDQREAAEFSAPKLNCFHIARVISSSPNTHYVVPTASGFAIEGFARFYKTTRGSRFEWAGHVLGSMGLAIGSAIGAARRLKRLVGASMAMEVFCSTCRSCTPSRPIQTWRLR